MTCHFYIHTRLYIHTHACRYTPTSVDTHIPGLRSGKALQSGRLTKNAIPLADVAACSAVKTHNRQGRCVIPLNEHRQSPRRVT